MNYIVFDLEWNQNPSGKKTRNDRLPFEIIEIGAVKVNSKKEWQLMPLHFFSYTGIVLNEVPKFTWFFIGINNE